MHEANRVQGYRGTECSRRSVAQAMKQHRNKKSFLCQAAFEVHMSRSEKKREKTRRQSLKNLTKITVNTEVEHGVVRGVLFGCVLCVPKKNNLQCFASS